MIAAPAAVAAVSPMPAAAACAAMIRRGDAARIDQRCWRVGPLAIGMSREDVKRVLGPSSTSYDVQGPDFGPRKGRHFVDQIYVFPQDLAARLAAHSVASVEFNLLELTFDAGKLIRIDNAPGYSVSGPRCSPESRARKIVAVDPASFAPFQRFAGVRVGERLTQVRRVLGRSSTVSNGRDFYNYSPVPLTLAAWDTERLNGFAIGADDDAVTLGSAPSIVVDKDPATCRVRGFRFVDSRPGQ